MVEMIRKITILLFVSMISLMLCATEIAPRVKGLENNPEYMALLGEEKLLIKQEDSLNKELTNVRDLFNKTPEERAKYGSEILRLESEIFDIRNNKGIVSGKISSIEQNYVVANLSAGIAVTTMDTIPENEMQMRQSPYFVDNEILSQYLSNDDYKALVAAQQDEVPIANFVKIYGNNYNAILKLIDEYEVADNHVDADRLYSNYEQLQKINMLIADSVNTLWDKVFDNKSYAYNYILDKLNKTAMLGEFEERVKNISSSEFGDVMSKAISLYATEKNLLINYELDIAKMLGLTQSVDSLTKAITKLEETQTNFAAIDLRPRVFIKYEDLAQVNKTLYTAKNPIPKTEVLNRGIVYRVLVGSYQHPQPASAFKGLNPMSMMKVGTKNDYFAGGFRTVEEAKSALDVVVGMGFKKASLVVWSDGNYEQLSEEDYKEGGAVYRVEILGAGESLTQAIKDVIEETAPDKEIGRIYSESGNYVYTIGNFPSQAAAQKLAELLDGIQDGITTKVLTLN